MKKPHRLAIIIVIFIAAHVLVPVASAHPLGNFTINHYVGLDVSQERIYIEYILDMAEIPAFQEIAAFDANGNGQADVAETAGYHATKCVGLRPDLELRLNDRLLALDLISSSVEFPPGVGGLPTLRLTCNFQAALDETGENFQVTFKNNAYPKRLGWREIVVTGKGTSLQGDYSTTSLSNRLTSYPQDLLSSPLDQHQISLNVALWPVSSSQKVLANNEQALPVTVDKNDAFTRLILLENITLPTLLLALVVAFLWGALHAMTPGHGKTIVGAYLVGARGTAKHALYLGLTTTITHTAGVFALGLVTLFAARFILPEKLFPWLSFISGLLVVGIGVNLFLSRLRASGLATWFGEVMYHTRGHEHDPGHDHHHPHSHEHHLDHDHSHEHDHAHEHGPSHAHHSHLPPGADGSPVSWRTLLALGISGGLLPCPSALVVLLSAIALNRIGFGLILVLVFSVGLAGVLTGIGLLFVYAGRLFNRVPVQSRLLGLLPAASALFITLVGLGITARALVEVM